MDLFNQCLQSLRNARTDTEKFAALLLVTKVFKSETLSSSIKRELFQAIGDTFLNRLLHTDIIPPGCPSHIFKSIALAVLAALCSETDKEVMSAIVSNIDVIKQIVSIEPQSPEDKVMVDDALLCVNFATSDATELKVLVKCGLLDSLIEVCRFLEDNGVKRIVAQTVVQKFYDYIRSAAQDPSGRLDVDTWRTSLWSKSLGPKLKFYSDKAYRQWKEERKNFLGLERHVQSMLHELRKYYKLGLITNGPSKAQWEKVHHVDAYQYFEVVLVSGDHQYEKPDPFIFQLAFDHLGVKAKDCIMIGDKIETDIEGGVNAGVACTVLICPKGLDWDDIDTKPDFIVKNVCDVMEILPLKGKQRRLSVKDRAAVNQLLPVPPKLCLAQKSLEKVEP